MKPQIRDTEFEGVVRKMVAEKNYANYMKGALKDYQAYLRFMDGAFLEEPDDHWCTMRATYRRKKGLWREIEIHGRRSLADLASCIIHSMDWMEDHLHGYWFPDERRNRIYSMYGVYHENMEDDPHPTFKTQDVPVSQINWKKYPTLGFVFDFGDDHEFDITLKRTSPEVPKGKRQTSARLIDQRGVAPEQYPDYEE